MEHLNGNYQIFCGVMIPIVEIFKDGINADRVGKDYKHEIVQVSSDKKLKLHMASGGGFVVKIVK